MMNSMKPMFYSLMIATFLQTGPLAAQEEKPPLCKETCQAQREENTKQYQNCVGRAEQDPDQLNLVKRKQNCRQKYPVRDCEALPACSAIKPEEGQARQTLTMGALELFSGTEGEPSSKMKKHFRAGQTIWVQYPLSLKKGKGGRLWFDQDVTVYDSHGNEVLQDQQSFDRSGEMVSSYQFKSSFVIPAEFVPGEYKLKVRLRERFIPWEGEKEETFSVGKGK